MKKGEIRLKKALQILAQKWPVSKPTFNDWCDRGIVPFRVEKRGVQKVEWRFFKQSDIERLRDRLPDEPTRGLGLLPETTRNFISPVPPKK